MDIFPTTKQRAALLKLTKALVSRGSALRRDECGDWRIEGSSGHVYRRARHARPTEAPPALRSLRHDRVRESMADLCSACSVFAKIMAVRCRRPAKAGLFWIGCRPSRGRSAATAVVSRSGERSAKRSLIDLGLSAALRRPPKPTVRPTLKDGIEPGKSPSQSPTNL